MILDLLEPKHRIAHGAMALLTTTIQAKEINNDIQSSRRTEPDCKPQGYLLVLAKTVVTFARGIRRSCNSICTSFPSRNGGMTSGIDPQHSEILLFRYDVSRCLGCSAQRPFLVWSCGYQKHGIDKRRLGSVGLASRVNLGAEIGSSGSGLREVAREDGLDEGTENDLGTATRCQLSNVRRKESD